MAGLNRILGYQPFQVVGNTSYSIYLWHWPLLLFATQAGWPVEISLVLSVLAGWLSWRFVEQPTRKRVPIQKLLWGYASVLLIAVAWSHVVRTGNGLPQRLPAYLIQAAEANEDKNPLRERCFHDQDGNNQERSLGCVVGVNSSPPSIALWGDSHADQIQETFDRVAMAQGRNAIVFTHAGCPPFSGKLVPGSGIEQFPTCEAYANKVADRISNDRVIKVVVLAADWERYETGFMTERLRVLSDRLGKTGKILVFVGSVPDPQEDVPRMWAQRERTAGRAIDTWSVPLVAEKVRHQHSMDILSFAEGNKDILTVDPFIRFCNETNCYTVYGGKGLYVDANHLSMSGANWLREDLANAISEGLRRKDDQVRDGPKI